MSSRIILTRDAEYFAMWRKFRVFVDGKKVGTIRRGETRHFFVRPGQHQVQVRIDWWRSNSVNVEIAREGTLHLQCGSNWKGWRLMMVALLSWLFILWPKGWLWLRVAYNKEPIFALYRCKRQNGFWGSAGFWKVGSTSSKTYGAHAWNVSVEILDPKFSLTQGS